MIRSILIIIVLAISYLAEGQIVESDKIEWANLKSYSAPEFKFTTDQIEYSCNNCRFRRELIIDLQ